MTFKTRCHYARGVVDPAPLVDVVFLLLIFFVLSSPYVLQTGFGLSLPTSDVPDRVSLQSMVVVIKGENQILFNDRRVTFDQLGQSLVSAAGRSPNQDLIIKADGQVPHSVIIHVLNIAYKAGIATVNLATRPEVPTLSPPPSELPPTTTTEPSAGSATPK